MAGLADAKGHLTRTYQYSVTGEPTYGAAAYENEYAYNGESYSPNIHSQYLWARYYNVATASFLAEDSYLGSIWGPLTLNRYNYCISSYPNYEDPSGNMPMLTPVIPSRIVPPDTVPETIREDIALLNFEVWMGAEYTRLRILGGTRRAGRRMQIVTRLPSLRRRVKAREVDQMQ